MYIHPSLFFFSLHTHLAYIYLRKMVYMPGYSYSVSLIFVGAQLNEGIENDLTVPATPSELFGQPRLSLNGTDVAVSSMQQHCAMQQSFTLPPCSTSTTHLTPPLSSCLPQPTQPLDTVCSSDFATSHERHSVSRQSLMGKKLCKTTYIICNMLYPSFYLYLYRL